jgi:hypothetical protein
MEEDEKDLWDTMKVIATLAKFTSLLRSVRRDAEWKGNDIFYCLRKMQEIIIFPYSQQYCIFDQGSEFDYCSFSKYLSREEASV